MRLQLLSNALYEDFSCEKLILRDVFWDTQPNYADGAFSVQQSFQFYTFDCTGCPL